MRAEPLYVGGCTGRSKRFCTRVGDLIADMFGFFDGGTGHHSGGQTLYSWCTKNEVNPGDLFLSWARGGPGWCARCAERKMFDDLPRAPPRDFDAIGLRNKKRPPRCSLHT